MRNTVANNQRHISPGANFMLLNGMLVEVKNFEIYSECCWAVHHLYVSRCPTLQQSPVWVWTCTFLHTVNLLTLRNTL